MSGKGVTFLLDPFSEFENNRIQPNNEQLNIPSSNLNKLFSKWGFEIKPGHIVGDILQGCVDEHTDCLLYTSDAADE